MTKRSLAAASSAAALALSAIASAQHHQAQAPAPYAGQQSRAIKALSPGEIEGYSRGRGMGLAKPAELNS